MLNRGIGMKRNVYKAGMRRCVRLAQVWRKAEVIIKKQALNEKERVSWDG